MTQSSKPAGHPPAEISEKITPLTNVAKSKTDTVTHPTVGDCVVSCGYVCPVIMPSHARRASLADRVCP